MWNYQTDHKTKHNSPQKEQPSVAKWLLKSTVCYINHLKLVLVIIGPWYGVKVKLIQSDRNRLFFFFFFQKRNRISIFELHGSAWKLCTVTGIYTESSLLAIYILNERSMERLTVGICTGSFLVDSVFTSGSVIV